jgi:hypothetical protein
MLFHRLLAFFCTAVLAAVGLGVLSPPAAAVGQQPVFPVQTPAFAVNPDGRLEVFAVDGNGKLWHNWENARGSFKEKDAGGTSTGFHGWDGIGGNNEVRPGVTAIVREDGRLQVYARGVDNTVKEVHQTNFGIWSSWRSLGGSAQSGPAAVRAADNRQVVYFRGDDNAPFMFRSRGPNSDDYDIRRRDGGHFKGDPAVLRAPSGMVNVFVRGMDDRLYRFEETNFDAAQPRWEYNIGSEAITSKPAPALKGSRFVVYMISTGTRLIASEQISDATDPAWARLSVSDTGRFGDPAAVNSSSQVPQVWQHVGVFGPIQVLENGVYTEPSPNVNAAGSPGAAVVGGTQHAAVIADDGRLYYCGRYLSGSVVALTGFMRI